MTTPLVIVGAGGHGREMLDIVHAVNEVRPTFDFLGFVADGPPDAEVLARLDAPFLGAVDVLRGRRCAYVIGVGSGTVRRHIAERLTGEPCHAAVLVHPQATLGGDVVCGEGVVIAAGARVTTNVRLGRHTQLNVNSSVSHDCRLGDYVTVSPGSVVCGTVVLDDEVYVGANACIVQNLHVAAGSTIGAGAVVVRDVDAGVTVAGVPARLLA